MKKSLSFRALKKIVIKGFNYIGNSFEKAGPTKERVC